MRAIHWMDDHVAGWVRCGYKFLSDWASLNRRQVNDILRGVVAIETAWLYFGGHERLIDIVMTSVWIVGTWLSDTFGSASSRQAHEGLFTLTMRVSVVSSLLLTMALFVWDHSALSVLSHLYLVIIAIYLYSCLLDDFEDRGGKRKELLKELARLLGPKGHAAPAVGLT